MPYKIRIFKKWCLVCLGLFAAALALSWLQSAASAAQSESQLVADTQSEATGDVGFGQTFDLTSIWQALDTTIELDIENLSTAKTITFGWIWDNVSYNCAGAGWEFEVPAYTRFKKTLTTSAYCIQAMIDDGWNSAAIKRGWQFYLGGGNMSNIRFWGSSNANSYPDGFFAKDYSWTPAVVVKDAYFKISSALQNAIEITFPENATSTADFGNFLLNWTAVNPTSTYVGIGYGATSTIWTFSDESGAGTENENENVVFPKMNLLSLGHYFARAWLFEYDENWNKIYLATSTLIEFDITEGTYIPFFYPTPTSTATSTEWVLTCDPEAPLFQHSLCVLFRYIFTPKQEDFNRFFALKDILATKPPIGYFYAIKNALIFSATSTPAFNLENASTTLAASIYNPLKTGIQFLLWLVFCFWVFNRIRKLEL